MAGETEPERQAQLCLRNACALREHIELHAPRWRVERVAAAAARWSRTVCWFFFLGLHQLVYHYSLHTPTYHSLVLSNTVQGCAVLRLIGWLDSGVCAFMLIDIFGSNLARRLTYQQPAMPCTDPRRCR